MFEDKLWHDEVLLPISTRLVVRATSDCKEQVIGNCNELEGF